MRKISLLPFAVLLLGAGRADAINNSVSYLRGGLPYSGPTGVSGLGAFIGELEVQGSEGNGIDGFSGHRQGGLVNFLDVLDFRDGDPTDEYFHGTFVAGVMASAYTDFTGVALDAMYYGAVFNGADSKVAYLSLYNSMEYLARTSGVSAVNHSWGGSVTAADELTGSLYSEALLMDEYSGYAGKISGTAGGYLDRLMVIAAGNNGKTTGLLGTPADSFNGLTVGALDAGGLPGAAWDDPARTPLPVVAAYSSWRPLANGRAGVDVVAPGTHIWSTLAINYYTNANLVAGTADGTSFAAPHVTGEAALLYGRAVDYNGTLGIPALASDKGTLLSTDHKLIKAVIINSADKIAGKDSNGLLQSVWTPGAVSVVSGVTNALVPLNYAVGAGKANAKEALLQYQETGNRFWDLFTLTNSGSAVYYTYGTGRFTNSTPSVPEYLNITATLNWDRHIDFTVNTDPGSALLGTVDKNLLSNLDLVLQRESSPGTWEDVYKSAGLLDSTEHLYMNLLPGNISYRIGVLGTNIAEPAIGEQYALAVNFAAVPEPGAALLLMLVAAGLAVRRRHKALSRRPTERRVSPT